MKKYMLMLAVAAAALVSCGGEKAEEAVEVAEAAPAVEAVEETAEVTEPAYTINENGDTIWAVVEEVAGEVAETPAE